MFSNLHKNTRYNVAVASATAAAVSAASSPTDWSGSANDSVANNLTQQWQQKENQLPQNQLQQFNSQGLGAMVL